MFLIIFNIDDERNDDPRKFAEFDDECNSKIVIGTVGQFIRIQTAQAHGIEEFSITAGKQTWVTINAGDQSSTISGYGESWVGPELGGSAVGRHFVRTLEADYFLRVAVGQQLIGPDAIVTLRVVNQSCVAMIFVGMAMGASDIGGAAGIARRVKAELIFASRTADRCQVSLAIPAMDGPVIVAVIVHGAMPVEK